MAGGNHSTPSAVSPCIDSLVKGGCGLGLYLTGWLPAPGAGTGGAVHETGTQTPNEMATQTEGPNGDGTGQSAVARFCDSIQEVRRRACDRSEGNLEVANFCDPF